MNLKLILGFIVVGLVAGLIPFGLIALARSQPSPLPPVHPQQDIFKQVKFKSQRTNPMFADNRGMRPQVPGTTARTDLEIKNEMVYDAERPHMIDDSDKPIDLNNELSYQRITEGTEPQDGKPAYVKKIPVKVTTDLLLRGRQRFTINCAICHGQAGYGDGTVALRADQMKEAQGDAAGWVKPKDFHTDDLRAQPVGQIFNTITNGARSMPSYAKQVSVLDRWAIVAYVKALQLSQNAKPGDVPEAEREKYK